MEKIFKYYCGTCQKKKRKSLFYDKSEHSFDKHKKDKQQIQEFPKEISNYIVLAHIGSGGCGNVFQVCEKSNQNQKYALKICSDLDLKSEILINKNLNHPNLIKFYDSQIVSEKKEFVIVQELGDIDLEKNLSILQQDQIYNIILEIAEGVKYLHEKNILHLDLKLNNILLKDNHVKIIDFGMSKQKNEINFQNDTEPLSFPSQYSPPEWHRNSLANDKADIWAFGIVCHLIVAKNNPFGEDWKKNIPNYIINIDKSILINSSLYELIINCLNKEKNNRWEMKKIVEFIRLNKDNFFGDQKKKEKQNVRKKIGPCKTDFTWDPNCKGNFITLSENNLKININNDKEFIYRSILANKGFKEGIHYWEIEFNDNNLTQPKVGVYVKKKEINPNECFSNFEDGYAYYGFGEKRNNNDVKGFNYGVEFSSGIVGVFLDMDEGILSFSLNGKYLRRAFKEDNLTGNNFEIFPAVSLVYSGECKLILKDQIPDIFFENN